MLSQIPGRSGRSQWTLAPPVEYVSKAPIYRARRPWRMPDFTGAGRGGCGSEPGRGAIGHPGARALACGGPALGHQVGVRVGDRVARDAQVGGEREAGSRVTGAGRPERTASRSAFVSPLRRPGPVGSTCGSNPGVAQGCAMEMDHTPGLLRS